MGPFRRPCVQTLSCGLSPATGLAGIHVVTQLLQFVILGQLSVVADLLKVAYALGLRKDVQAALLQLEASCLGRHWDRALLTWIVLKQLRQTGTQQALNLCLQGNLGLLLVVLFLPFNSVFVDLQSLSCKLMDSQTTRHLRVTGAIPHHTYNRSNVTNCSCTICRLLPLCSAWLQHKRKHVASGTGQS